MSACDSNMTEKNFKLPHLPAFAMISGAHLPATPRKPPATIILPGAPGRVLRKTGMDSHAEMRDNRDFQRQERYERFQVP